MNNDLTSKFIKHFNPVAFDYINNENVYHFYHTISQKDLRIRSNSIVISQHPSFTTIPYHDHNFLEIMVVLTGSCTVNFEHETTTISENEMLLIGEYIPHKVKPTSPTDNILNLVIKKSYFYKINASHDSIYHAIELIQDIFMSSNKNNSVILVKGTDELIHILKYGWKEESDSSELSEYFIDTYMELFLVKLSLNNFSFKQIKGPKKLSIDNLLTFIELHYQTITLDTIATYFNRHPNYISFLLKKELGYSFKYLVQLTRLNKAISYLRDTSLSIEQITEKVGYSNAKQLYNIFQKFLDTTPGDIRKM